MSAPRFTVCPWHGEGRTVFYVVDGAAPLGYQPAIVATFPDRASADRDCQSRNGAHWRPVLQCGACGAAGERCEHGRIECFTCHGRPGEPWHCPECDATLAPPFTACACGWKACPECGSAPDPARCPGCGRTRAACEADPDPCDYASPDPDDDRCRGCGRMVPGCAGECGDCFD